MALHELYSVKTRQELEDFRNKLDGIMPADSLIKNVLTYFDDDAEKCYFKFYGFTDSRNQNFSFFFEFCSRKPCLPLP